MRTHPEPIGYYSPSPRPVVTPPPPSTVLFAIADADRLLYSGDKFTRWFAHTTTDSARLIAANMPSLVVVDWDQPRLDAVEISRVTRTLPHGRLLGTTDTVSKVPMMLKAGTHAILLKPFAPNLLAARIGRTLRETTTVRGQMQPGPTKVCDDIACPQCDVAGATGFDHYSHRRMWFACLSCDHTWLGPRRE
jgi:hypothetical protein